MKAPASQIQHHGSGVDKSRQEGPHAHCITVAPGSAGGNERVLVADLGLDKILLYRLAEDGRLTPNEPASASAPAGAGPRHIAFGRSGRFVYVNNEMGSSVTAYRYDPGSGAMTQLQTLSTLPEGADRKGNSTAEIAVHPSGRFCYVSNRGHNSIAVFKVDPQSGKLTAAGHAPTGGKTPRSFGIDPAGQFLLAANQGSDTVVVFRIDPASGALTPTGTVANVPTPVCVTFLPR
jgi:6-phosphogluconolactonase